MRSRPRHQSGFTIVELIITMCIAAILGSIAISQMADYTRRARVSEVVLATGQCKNKVSEGYVVRDSAPAAGAWDCEGGAGTEYAGPVQTSTDGVIRVPIRNVSAAVDGRYIYLIPAKGGGNIAMTTPDDLGDNVQGWICGSDWALARNALPANCRTDTTTYASGDFGP